MGTIVKITDKPVRVSATGDQDLRLAIDALEFDELDIALHVLSVEGTSPSVTVALETGMENDAADGWTTLGSAYTAVTASNSVEYKNFKNFGRYVRWSVTALSGTSPVATFTLIGVGRKWS